MADEKKIKWDVFDVVKDTDGSFWVTLVSQELKQIKVERYTKVKAKK